MQRSCNHENIKVSSRSELERARLWRANSQSPSFAVDQLKLRSRRDCW